MRHMCETQIGKAYTNVTRQIMHAVCVDWATLFLILTVLLFFILLPAWWTGAFVFAEKPFLQLMLCRTDPSFWCTVAADYWRSSARSHPSAYHSSLLIVARGHGEIQYCEFRSFSSELCGVYVNV